MEKFDSQNNGNHAVVFGCSGINGWALVNQLLSGYPPGQAFAKVTAIAHRPFTVKEAQWPQDDRLEMLTGIDLLARDDDALVRAFTEKVASVDTISHIYYAGEVLSSFFVVLYANANQHTRLVIMPQKNVSIIKRCSAQPCR